MKQGFKVQRFACQPYTLHLMPYTSFLYTFHPEK